ncbi:MAG: alternative ribosome rescue aminoacyl-tRNA hydrolase ArfB [Candidatus Krumholzibacteria bacterium]|nr:alternative ribosome rescue aminoacyl-tRNA hydrolase ArfB [Candidatus Krumholzibacteria bacterium]
MIRVNRTVAIDESELRFEFIRSSGPGGQNVNKVATAVRLRFDAGRSPSLIGEARERLLRLAGKKAGEDGVVAILARRHRTQEANRNDAVERLIALIRRACERPAVRRRTRPTAAARKRRLEAKRIRGRAKAGRQAIREAEE